MINTKTAIIFSLFSALSSSAFSADNMVNLGKQKSMICASCHGSKGISNSPLWPNLAGQKAAYLEKQLKDFRSDVRKDPMMAPMAKQLSDDDIKAIASYYASLTKP